MLHVPYLIIEPLAIVWMVWYQVQRLKWVVYVLRHRSVMKIAIVLMVWHVSRPYVDLCVLMIRVVCPTNVVRMAYVNLCAEEMTIADIVKYAWVCLAFLVADLTTVVLITYPVFNNNVWILAPMLELAAQMPNVRLLITIKFALALKVWWAMPNTLANLQLQSVLVIATVKRINCAMAVAVKASAVMIKTVWLMRSVCAALAVLYAIQILPVPKGKYVKIVFARLAAVMI